MYIVTDPLECTGKGSIKKYPDLVTTLDLDLLEVPDEKEPRGYFLNKPGKTTWKIKGWVDADYYAWCPSFVATDDKGKVVELSNNVFRATDKETFDRFWKEHEKDLSGFDLADI